MQCSFGKIGCLSLKQPSEDQLSITQCYPQSVAINLEPKQVGYDRPSDSSTLLRSAEGVQ